MPLRHEKEIEEILARAGLDRPTPWWRRWRLALAGRWRLRAPSSLIAAGVVVLLVGLLLGQFQGSIGLGLVLAGLALLALGYLRHLTRRRKGPPTKTWRGRPTE